MRISTALVLALVLVAAGCGHGGSTQLRPPAGPTPVVVDTDLSTDDILALLYLAQNTHVDIRAVTVSGTGVVRCPQGAANALSLLAYTGHADVPVACGRTEPLAGFNAFPGQWRDAADAFYGLELPRARRAAAPGGAEALLRSVLREAGAKLTVLSLAPMTNTAAVLRRDPSLRARIAGVYAMGGAVAVQGNIGAGHEHSEYNLWADPTAAQIVLSSGVPVTLVPLDATNDVPIRPALATTLRRHAHATRAASAGSSLLQRNPMIYSGGQYLWDPLAAAAVTAPALLRFAERRLAVVTAPGSQAGRIVESPNGTRMRVALAADGAAFERHYVRVLLGGRRVGIASRPPDARITFDGQRCTYAGPRRLRAGSITFDTVDRSGAGYGLVIGTLHEGRALADVRAAVARAHDRLGSWSWLSVSSVGSTPPDGRITWLANVEPGRESERLVLGCIDAAGAPTFAPTTLVSPGTGR